MKRYIIATVLISIAGVADGASFNYYAGRLSAFCKVYAEDSTDYDGPYTDSNDDTSFAMVAEYAEVDYAYSYADNSIWDDNDSQNHSICLRVNSYADTTAEQADCNVIGYGYGATEDSQTYGIFYQIVSDEGEEIGDEVIVYCVSTIKVAAWGSTYIYIGGPATLSHISITKGLLPPVLTDPESEYEVWGIENLELTDESFDWYSGVYSFRAKIGDVIGIFAENYTDVSGLGELDGSVESDLTIGLTAETILSGDLDDDNDVDFNDLAILGKNWLKDKN